MRGTWQVPGAAPSLFVLDGTPLLRADEKVFEAMLGGWRDQQASRNLHADTIRVRPRPCTSSADLPAAIGNNRSARVSITHSEPTVTHT